MGYELRCLGNEIYSTDSLDKLLAEAPAYDAECEHTHEIVLVIKPDSRQEEVTPEWYRIQQALKERDELAERVKSFEKHNNGLLEMLEEKESEIDRLRREC